GAWCPESDAETPVGLGRATDHRQDLVANERPTGAQVGRGDTDRWPPDREELIPAEVVARERLIARVPEIALVLERELPLRQRRIDPSNEPAVVPHHVLRHGVRN